MRRVAAIVSGGTSSNNLSGEDQHPGLIGHPKLDDLGELYAWLLEAKDRLGEVLHSADCAHVAAEMLAAGRLVAGPESRQRVHLDKEDDGKPGETAAVEDQAGSKANGAAERAGTAQGIEVESPAIAESQAAPSGPDAPASDANQKNDAPAEPIPPVAGAPETQEPAQPVAEAALPPVAPAKILASWGEILEALGLKKQDREKVARLNRTRDGPIKPGRKGEQPIVNLAKLLEWWNRLTIEYEVGENRSRDAKPTTAASHEHGREGVALPDIGGSERKRRADRKP
jgi:hypothetical protein